MKRVVSLLVSFCVFTPFIMGQEIKVALYDGWAFARTIDNYHYTSSFYEGNIQPGWRQGLGVSCFLENSFDLGLVYYRLKTDVPTTFYSAGNTFHQQFEMKIQWFLVDFVAYMAKKFVRPFLGSDMGLGVITLNDPLTGSQASRTKFTWGGNLGIEFAFPKFISIRIKADALYSVKFSSPSGVSGSGNITAYNSYLQTAINGAIVFRFKMHHKK